LPSNWQQACLLATAVGWLKLYSLVVSAWGVGRVRVAWFGVAVASLLNRLRTAREGLCLMAVPCSGVGAPVGFTLQSSAHYQVVGVHRKQSGNLQSLKEGLSTAVVNATVSYRCSTHSRSAVLLRVFGNLEAAGSMCMSCTVQ
jgi:hypothetical protein